MDYNIFIARRERAKVNNKPGFCLADVCKILGLEQVSGVKSTLNANGVTTSKGRGADRYKIKW